VFRFIATHPDMDHLDGFKLFCQTFDPANFWGTDNQEEKDFGEETKYDEADWLFYKKLRDSNPETNPKRLTLYSGARGKYESTTTRTRTTMLVEMAFTFSHRLKS
jgi:competence protein ComEC